MADGGVGIVYAFSMARYASGKPLAERKRSPRWRDTPKPPFPQPIAHTKKQEVYAIDKKKKQPNRQRPFAYSFRVSAAEKTLLDRKVTASGMNRTDYLIRTLSDKPIVSIDNGHEILYELKRHGNNLNQAVKSGYYGYDTEQEILSAVAECKRVYRKLSEALGGV